MSVGYPVAHTTSLEVEYFKGFYDACTNKLPQSFYETIYPWVSPIFVNTFLFLLPVYYFKRKAAAEAVRAATSSASRPTKKSSSIGSIMEMMLPLQPRSYRVEVKGTRFADVIGIPEAKEELVDYINFLKTPSKYTRLGGHLQKGCLLTGNPGTGKTLLARAVAGEADVAFLACSSADFIEVFGGSGPKRVRELFTEAKAAAPCVCFIDELDAIGSRGGSRSMEASSSEENRTINQLLAELDGLQTEENVIVIGATNYPEAIDKALLREGRFDRKINIPMPDKTARRELFEFYLKRIVTGDPACRPHSVEFKTKAGNENKQKEEINAEVPKYQDGVMKLAKYSPDKEKLNSIVEVVPGVNNKEYASLLAERTPGVTPAQISTIINEAALSAAIDDKSVVSLEYLQNAIDDVLIGKKSLRQSDPASLRRTAFHECGHTIMAWLSPIENNVIKVSIISRGMAGGYTQQMENEAISFETNEALESKLCVLLGGRAAEKLIFRNISAGAMDDLQRATKIATEQILVWKMGPEGTELSFRMTGRNEGRAWMNYSQKYHNNVELEAKKLISFAYRKTLKTLEKNKENLYKLGELLLENKELSSQQIEKILGEKGKGLSF